jgi:hypothetical protein
MEYSLPELRINPEYYVGCFSEIKTPDNVKSVVYCRSFDTTDVYDAEGKYRGQNSIMRAIDQKGKAIAFDTKTTDIHFPIYPTQYWFNGTRALLLSRLPVRKREKGVTLSNTELLDPVKRLIPHLNLDYLAKIPFPPARKKKKGLRDLVVNRLEVLLDGGERNYDDPPAGLNKVLYEYLRLFNYNVRRLPLRVAMNWIVTKDKVISVPVDYDWAVAPSFTEDWDFTIFRRMIPVALMRGDMKAVLLENLYKQEFIDKFPEARQ